MRYKTIITPCFFVVLYGIFSAPSVAFANYYSLPLDPSDIVNVSAYFDHDDDEGEKKFYDGTSGYNYDDHRGVDFYTATAGKNVLAAATGTVAVVGWQDPGDEAFGYGFRVYLYHGDYAQRTIYGHMASTSTVFFGNTLSRGQMLGVSSSTGTSTAPHLHFGVYDCDCTTPSEQVDPYGWWSEGIDPWPYNVNRYLWTTDPPSLDAYEEITANITASTTWRGNYVVSGPVPLDSGVVLTIAPGTIVKFEGSTSGLNMNGALDARGTATLPVYFTSFKDDIAGDWNGDGATSPAAKNWDTLKLNAGASTTLSHAIVRYGGRDICCPWGASTNIQVDGGNLTVIDSIVSNGNFGIMQTSVAATTSVITSELRDNLQGGFYINSGYAHIASSTIKDNGDWGIYAPINSPISIFGNTFESNSPGAVYLGINTLLTHGLNTATGTGKGAFVMPSDLLLSNRTLMKDSMPYLFAGTMFVNSGKTLTIEPGAIMKLDGGFAKFSVSGSGTLNAIGTSGEGIYFTSVKDDSIGGDTNGDDSGTSPTGGNWDSIVAGTGGTVNLAYATVKYGGNGTGSNLSNEGGTLSVGSSTATLSSGYGFLLGSTGTTTIWNSQIIDNGYIALHNGASATTTAENNYWGASTGPYHATLNATGTGATTTGPVDFVPWLTAAP